MPIGANRFLACIFRRQNRMVLPKGYQVRNADVEDIRNDRRAGHDGYPAHSARRGVAVFPNDKSGHLTA